MGMTRNLLIVTVFASLLSACGGGGGSGGTGNSQSPCNQFDCQAMVDNLATNVILPTYEAFENRAAELVDAVDAYQAALNDGNPSTNDDARSVAQDAWKEAMAIWQRAELMQVGPLLDNSSSLRDTLYSWPATGTCDVDQEVILAEESGYDITGRTPKRRGLDALEYLLFTDTLEHTCSPAVTITQGWNARSDEDRWQARLDFLVLASVDLHDQAKDLLTRWQPSGGNFIGELQNPGSNDSRYGNVESAVNALSDALFYLEKETNDTKLALPAGIKSNACGSAGTPCPEDVESPVSRTSKENIRQNMLGFQLMFLGNASGETDAPGFSEFLAAQSEEGESVAQNMSDDLDQSFVELDAISGSLYDAVQDANGRVQVSIVHDQLGLVNRQLKNQFLQVLGLTIPDAAAGDGD